MEKLKLFFFLSSVFLNLFSFGVYGAATLIGIFDFLLAGDFWMVVIFSVISAHSVFPIAYLATKDLRG